MGQSQEGTHIPKPRLRRVVRRIADALSLLSPAHASVGRSTPCRIGILLQWGIGDAVLSLPLIQGLKEVYPQAHIDLIGKPWLTDLFSGETAINGFRPLVPPWTKYGRKYRVWEKDWRDYVRQLAALRHDRYDLLIAPRFDARDNLQLRLLRAWEKAGFAAAGGRRWITRDLGLDLDSHNALHRAAVSTKELRILTGATRPAIPQFTVAETLKRNALTQLRVDGYAGGPIVAVHGGAGHPVRRWSGERFSAVLAEGLPKGTFVVVIADDTSPNGYGIRPPAGVAYTLWRGSLTELKGLLSIADVLLCADSGAMHMAAACGCRVVAVFGPQRVEWFGPAGERHHVVKVEPMPCRPCFDACIYAQPVCMDAITTDNVVAAIASVFEKFCGYRGQKAP